MIIDIHLDETSTFKTETSRHFCQDQDESQMSKAKDEIETFNNLLKTKPRRGVCTSQDRLDSETWRHRLRSKGRTIQPELDPTDPVKSAVSESAVQYRSNTDSDLQLTVRKYTPINKRKCKMLHKWCGARNSAVSS